VSLFADFQHALVEAPAVRSDAGHPTHFIESHRTQCRRLAEHVNENPGTRPALWWRYNDAPEHVLWWLWRRQQRGAPTPLEPRHGSMFFLDCGQGAFAVTAAHVFEESFRPSPLPELSAQFLLEF
jgi:hypothetical protein